MAQRWKDFFGNGYLSFIEAKKIVSSLGIKNQKEWQVYCKTKKPKNIPNSPSKIYNNEWNGLADWLGNK